LQFRHLHEAAARLTQTVILALGGGAALGWAHIGAVRFLQQQNVQIAGVAGTSIGAIVAASIAAGKLDELEAIARSASFRTVLRYLDLHLKPGAVLGGKEIVRQLSAHFGAMRLEALPIPCVAVAADMLTAEEVVIRDGPVVEAVLASIAIPGVFPPQARDGRILADGGLVTPLPVAAARTLGAHPVIAINLQGDYAARAASAGFTLEADGTPPKKMPSVLKTTRASIGALLTALARQALALHPADAVIAPRVGSIDVGDFTKARELIKLGWEAAAESWPAVAAATLPHPDRR
jgi:NTE family protein